MSFSESHPSMKDNQLIGLADTPSLSSSQILILQIFECPLQVGKFFSSLFFRPLLYLLRNALHCYSSTINLNGLLTSDSKFINIFLIVFFPD